MSTDRQSMNLEACTARLLWHIAALPAGVPYEQQQFHALMTENGVLPVSPQEAAETAARLRAAIAARGVLRMPEAPGSV